MIRYRVAVLGIAILVWTPGCFAPNEQYVFRSNLRLPAYFPTYLQLTGVSEKSLAREHGLTPGALWEWKGVHDGPVPPGSKDYIKSPGVMMVQIGAMFDLDMGGERRSVEVDSVTGWFTRLGADDFSPLDDSPILGTKDTWPPEAREESGYYGVLDQRRAPGPGFGPGPPWWRDTLLWGEAIALQWNRDGVHHLLIAQDIEPMNERELFKMANSMAPSDSLTPSS